MNGSPSRKSGNHRKTWLINKISWFAPLLLLLLAGSYFLIRSPEGVPLRYGELKQLLQDDSVSFQDVQVTRTEIRGTVQARDRAFDGETASEYAPTFSFVTARGGLENDQELQRLLDARVGAYRGQSEDAGFRLLYYSILPPVFLVLVGVGLFVLFRWMGGGSFMGLGRSRAK